MEPTPGGSNRVLSDPFSGLDQKLSKLRTKMIQQFDIKEPRMREIVKEFRRICENVEKIQEEADELRTRGTVALIAGGLGVGAAVTAGVLAAPFTGGASLAAVVAAGGAGGASVLGGVLGGATAVAGGIIVGGTNVLKTSLETDSVKAADTMGKEFKSIVEPLKNTLKEIEETCEKLKAKTAEDQSGFVLLNMEEFRDILKYFSEEVVKQVSEKDIGSFFKAFLKEVLELKLQSEKAHAEAKSCSKMIDKLADLIVEVFRVTPTPEQDKQLRASIMQLANQGQKVIDECEKLQKHFKEILRQGQN